MTEKILEKANQISVRNKKLLCEEYEHVFSLMLEAFDFPTKHFFVEILDIEENNGKLKCLILFSDETTFRGIENQEFPDVPELKKVISELEQCSINEFGTFEHFISSIKPELNSKGFQVKTEDNRISKKLGYSKSAFTIRVFLF